MKRSYFLMVTAVSEGITGLLLLIIPEVLLKLLLGERATTPETIFYARCLGVVLVIFSAGCWLIRNQHGSARQNWFAVAALIYDLAAALLLAYLGLAHDMVGILLWPAVVLHTILAGWGALCHK